MRHEELIDERERTKTRTSNTINNGGDRLGFRDTQRKGKNLLYLVPRCPIYNSTQ
jgi:hypothetical protein